MENIQNEVRKNQAAMLSALHGFENKRKKYNLKKNISIFLACGLVIVLLTIVMLNPAYSNVSNNDNGKTVFSFALVFLMFGIFMFNTTVRKIIHDFKTEFKNIYYRDALKIVGDIEWFERENSYEESKVGLDDNILNKSALFGQYNRKTIDDEFAGNYDGVDFKISETHLWYKSGRRHSSSSEVFKGVIIQYNSNKNVLNRTIVSAKMDLTKQNEFLYWYLLLAFIPAILCFVIAPIHGILDVLYVLSIPLAIIIVVCLFVYMARKSEEPLNKVTLEDPEFNKRFNVYSSDEVEARYLITPSFMERLNNLQTVFGTNKIKCSFFDDKFMIAISTKKDLFEMGKINKPLDDPKNLETFYGEISAIYDMVYYFKLNEKTGM